MNFVFIEAHSVCVVGKFSRVSESLDCNGASKSENLECENVSLKLRLFLDLDLGTIFLFLLCESNS